MIEVSLVRDLVAIVGVFIGLSYYIMNIREVRRNRKVTLTNTMLQPFMSDEGNRNMMELFTMEWSSLDDFKAKYDHRNNPENSVKRMAIWNRCEAIGHLYREGMLDIKTIFASSHMNIQIMWDKFKPIIEMYRGSDFLDISYTDFEYLAKHLREFTKEDTPKFLID